MSLTRIVSPASLKRGDFILAVVTSGGGVGNPCFSFELEDIQPRTHSGVVVLNHRGFENEGIFFCYPNVHVLFKVKPKCPVEWGSSFFKLPLEVKNQIKGLL